MSKMIAFHPSDYPEAHEIARKYCDRCELDHALWEEETTISHGTDVTESGVTMGPMECFAEPIWRYVRRRKEGKAS